MKNVIFLIFFLFSFNLFAQKESKGGAVSYETIIQMNADTPEDGESILCFNEEDESFYYYNGSTWIKFLSEINSTTGTNGIFSVANESNANDVKLVQVYNRNMLRSLNRDFRGNDNVMRNIYGLHVYSTDGRGDFEGQITQTNGSFLFEADRQRGFAFEQRYFLGRTLDSAFRTYFRVRTDDEDEDNNPPAVQIIVDEQQQSNSFRRAALDMGTQEGVRLRYHHRDFDEVVLNIKDGSYDLYRQTEQSSTNPQQILELERYSVRIKGVKDALDNARFGGLTQMIPSTDEVGFQQALTKWFAPIEKPNAGRYVWDFDENGQVTFFEISQVPGDGVINGIAPITGDDQKLIRITNSNGQSFSRTWNDKVLSASEVRSRLITVDGTGSGVDSDLLDGQQGSFYRQTWNNLSGTPSSVRNLTNTDITNFNSAFLWGNHADEGYLKRAFTSGQIDRTHEEKGRTRLSFSGGSTAFSEIINSYMGYHNSTNAPTDTPTFNNGRWRATASYGLHAFGSQGWKFFDFRKMETDIEGLKTGNGGIYDGSNDLTSSTTVRGNGLHSLFFSNLAGFANEGVGSYGVNYDGGGTLSANGWQMNLKNGALKISGVSNTYQNATNQMYLGVTENQFGVLTIEPKSIVRTSDGDGIVSQNRNITGVRDIGLSGDLRFFETSSGSNAHSFSNRMLEIRPVSDAIYFYANSVVFGTGSTLDMSGNKIIRVDDPINNGDASNKKYVDDAIAAISSAGSNTGINIDRGNNNRSGFVQFPAISSDRFLVLQDVEDGDIRIVENTGNTTADVSANGYTTPGVDRALQPNDIVIFHFQDGQGIKLNYYEKGALDEDNIYLHGNFVDPTTALQNHLNTSQITLAGVFALRDLGGRRMRSMNFTYAQNGSISQPVKFLYQLFDNNNNFVSSGEFTSASPNGSTSLNISASNMGKMLVYYNNNGNTAANIQGLSMSIKLE